ncbi:MAG: hypothetical protein KVP17_000586 [Porospora cf. gigantea B]|uniref:uncharacterized protein n=1 Tax=Porospora cf. gigantea B TaxID=2853592 RepID=UPI003571AF61|nr:MAG: hypothetical protein KVP17_000586 [Porospora cf. gigantea B]
MDQGGRSQKTIYSSFSSTAAYEAGEVLGNGSFGVVCQVTEKSTGRKLAVKSVVQDPRYKNRELDIMKELNHPNIVSLEDYFYTNRTLKSQGELTDSYQPEHKFLNVVMEFIPVTMYNAMKPISRQHKLMPLDLMCRAIGYLHALGICHRDIKPQNLLVDPDSYVLKLCDFGSAKRLVSNEVSVAYICSRYYRAPELMLGSTNYTTCIDIWSIGCVFGELMSGKPLFVGDTSVDQLVRIMQVLGSPSQEALRAMNPRYHEMNMPQLPRVLPKSMTEYLQSHMDETTRRTRTYTPDADAVDLLCQLLCYEPDKRVQPYQCLAHPFFDKLRDSQFKLLGSVASPPLFNFTDAEKEHMKPALLAKIVPAWYHRNL